MKRIAIISIHGTTKAGGVEHVVARHARLLSEVASVRVFALPQSGWTRSIRRSKIGNLLVCCAFSCTVSFRARAWAGRNGVVITHAYGSIGASCDALFAHGCWAGYMAHTGMRMGGFGRFIYSVEWLGAHLARKVVGVSESVIDQWVRYYGLDHAKSDVQLNSVDTSVFFPRQSASDPCSDSSIRVLFVGRFEPGKGTAYLSHLHDEIASSGSLVQVLICSPADVTQDVRNRHPLFRFTTGLQPEEVAAECNKADLFLLPSLYEGFELSSIEALACGTPVMLNDTGSRPTLQKLSCPGLFALQNKQSPLDAVKLAHAAFRGLCRTDLARWAHAHFDGRTTRASLLALCGLSADSQ
ncbi:MAG TPA: glycosyltransferase [Terracidiphilus sp.]|nr:glycosyltransferase [Terracidiphilus sp.]